MRALAASLGSAALALLPGALAAPASAHGVSLPDASYYRSTVTAITPPVPGLDVQVTGSGENVTLTNHTSQTVVVIGYQGEDYLRISPTGVDENTNSLSAALNGTLVIEGLPQAVGQAGQSRPAAWSHVADSPSFSWHDHRVHWMAQQRPPVVAADPAASHHVFDWTIGLRVGGAPATVRGSLTWTGKPGLTGTPLRVVEVLGLGAGLVLVLLLVREGLKRRSATTAGAPASPQDEVPPALVDDDFLSR